MQDGSGSCGAATMEASGGVDDARTSPSDAGSDEAGLAMEVESEAEICLFVCLFVHGLRKP